MVLLWSRHHCRGLNYEGQIEMKKKYYLTIDLEGSIYIHDGLIDAYYGTDEADRDGVIVYEARPKLLGPLERIETIRIEKKKQEKKK